MPKVLTFQNMTKRSKDICRLIEPTISNLRIMESDDTRIVLITFDMKITNKYYGESFYLTDFPVGCPFRTKMEDLVELILSLENE